MNDPQKEYRVNVVYTMVHTMWVTAESAAEAEALAVEHFHEEPDLSDDEIDEVLRADVVVVNDDKDKNEDENEDEDEDEDDFRFYVQEALDELGLCNGCRWYFSAERSCEKETSGYGTCINRLYRKLLEMKGD